MEWISAKDELPNPGIGVLLYNLGEIGIGFYSTSGNMPHWGWQGKDRPTVTHWMPFPDAPNDED